MEAPAKIVYKILLSITQINYATVRTEIIMTLPCPAVNLATKTVPPAKMNPPVYFVSTIYKKI
jgi:hypothetical protein